VDSLLSYVRIEKGYVIAPINASAKANARIVFDFNVLCQGLAWID